MANTWLSVKVELLGGRDLELWPPPGRVFVVGPRHTFAELADAINLAFARWDLAHLCRFDLSDGSVVTDAETLEEMESLFSPPTSTHDADQVRVAELAGPGSAFRYLFDFGDDWRHACTVDTRKVDPLEVYGVVPKQPVPIWGWGDIPDQYGRCWEDDDGETDAPSRPAGGHPI